MGELGICTDCSALILIVTILPIALWAGWYSETHNYYTSTQGSADDATTRIRNSDSRIIVVDKSHYRCGRWKCPECERLPHLPRCL